MVYHNVKTDVLHWDFVSLPSLSSHAVAYESLRALFRGSSLSPLSIYSERLVRNLLAPS
jgi:hypothetical protein